MGLFMGSLFCYIDLYFCFMPVPGCFHYYSLLECLMSGSMIPPTSFFFPKIAVAIGGLLEYHINIWIICSSSLKNTIGIWWNFSFFFFLNHFIVVQLQLSAFSPHPSTPPQPNPHPSPASTLPLVIVHVSFIVVSEHPSPHCPFPPPLWLLLDCS